MTLSVISVCTHCGRKNRISLERHAITARCGKCHVPFFSGRAAEVDEVQFGQILVNDGLPLLVDVWAPWCGPCRAMSPAFEAAAAQLEPDMRLLKLNADGAPEIIRRFDIRSIPTVLLFDHGRLVARSPGAMSTPQIVTWARQHAPSEMKA